MRRLTLEDVQKFVSEESQCELLSTQYRTCTEKLEFRCKCGREFKTDFHHFVRQNQRQCPCCGKENQARRQRLTREDLDHRLAAIGCAFESGDYKNRKSNITIKCRCGHSRTSRLNTILTPSFSGLCQSCSDRKFRAQNRFTLDQIREWCAEKGVELMSEEYTDIKSPLCFRCACGEVFETSWEIVSYYNKTRCDTCTRKRSFGEQAIKNWLEERGIKHTTQKTFEGCGSTRRKFPFDFYLPDYDTCIEFDGQQHFKPVDFAGCRDEDRLWRVFNETRSHDLAKDLFCEAAGLHLIRIRFDEINRVDEILSDKLIPR